MSNITRKFIGGPLDGGTIQIETRASRVRIPEIVPLPLSVDNLLENLVMLYKVHTYEFDNSGNLVFVETEDEQFLISGY